MKAPTTEELQREIVLLWYRAELAGCGPSKFREVWKRDPVGALIYQFSQPVLPAYRRRNDEIIAWLQSNTLPREVTEFDPTHGSRDGDPPCCDMDPVYFWDQDGNRATAQTICALCKARLNPSAIRQMEMFG